MERLKSSFKKLYGRYGDLIQQYEVSLSRMLNAIRILDQLLSTIFVILIQNFTFTELWVVSMEHLQRVWHARERVPFRTPGTFPLFGTYIFSNCWDIFSRTCRVFSQLLTLNTPRYLLDFAFNPRALKGKTSYKKEIRSSLAGYFHQIPSRCHCSAYGPYFVNNKMV